MPRKTTQRQCKSKPPKSRKRMLHYCRSCGNSTEVGPGWDGDDIYIMSNDDSVSSRSRTRLIRKQEILREDFWDLIDRAASGKGGQVGTLIRLSRLISDMTVICGLLTELDHLHDPSESQCFYVVEEALGIKEEDRELTLDEIVQIAICKNTKG